MSRSVSYTRATSYLWCSTVIEVEPHRTAVGVYTPVECSSDLMRRAAISLSFLESDPPPIFVRPPLADQNFLEISFFPFHPSILSLRFFESRREISAEEGPPLLLAPWPRAKIIVMGFRARDDIDAWSTADGETGRGRGEGKRVEGKGGGAWMVRYQKVPAKGWGRAKRAARALNRPMAISNRMPWRCRCALIIKRRYNKARIIGHKARLG